MRRAEVHFNIKTVSNQITVMDQNDLNPNSDNQILGLKAYYVVTKDSKFVFFVKHLVLH